MSTRREKTHGTWVKPRFDPGQTEYPPEGAPDREAKPGGEDVLPGIDGQPHVNLRTRHRERGARPHGNGSSGVPNPAVLEHRDEDPTRPD